MQTPSNAAVVAVHDFSDTRNYVGCYMDCMGHRRSLCAPVCACLCVRACVCVCQCVCVCVCVCVSQSHLILAHYYKSHSMLACTDACGALARAAPLLLQGRRDKADAHTCDPVPLIVWISRGHTLDGKDRLTECIYHQHASSSGHAAAPGVHTRTLHSRLATWMAVRVCSDGGPVSMRDVPAASAINTISWSCMYLQCVVSVPPMSYVTWHAAVLVDAAAGLVLSNQCLGRLVPDRLGRLACSRCTSIIATALAHAPHQYRRRVPGAPSDEAPSRHPVDVSRTTLSHATMSVMYAQRHKEADANHMLTNRPYRHIQARTQALRPL
jgi:hypothetical protein